MKFKLCFIEWHSDVDFWKDLGLKHTATDSEDGWGEFEHVQEFEAESVDEAKKMVYDLDEMNNNSSGVFNVYQDDKLVFTEENI